MRGGGGNGRHFGAEGWRWRVAGPGLGGGCPASTPGALGTGRVRESAGAGPGCEGTGGLQLGSRDTALQSRRKPTDL